MSNPYKNVWDSSSDYYKTEIEKVGSALVPTFLEMARRTKATAQHFLWKARKEHRNGNSTLAQDYFSDAMAYRNVAEKMFEAHQREIQLSR